VATEHRGPPPLRPFGLVLHHDGSWTHEGQPIRNRKLREAFDHSVRYLPDEPNSVTGKPGLFVVQLGRFRGQIDVEEAGLFVREYDPPTGGLVLSDRSECALEVDSLHPSPRDGALLCRVKRDLVPDGLLARFCHAAQAELLHAVVEGESGLALCFDGKQHPLPDLEANAPSGRNSETP
jgi:hypothetical protein